MDRPGFEPGASRMPTQSLMSSPLKSKSVSKSVNYTKVVCLEITDELVSQFFRWLRHDNPRIKEPTVRQYSYYVPKLVGG